MIIAVLIALANPVAPSSTLETAGSLYDKCSSPAERGVCVGYIKGVVDSDERIGEFRLFVSKDTSDQKLVDSYQNFMAVRPWLRPQRAPLMVWVALFSDYRVSK